MAPAIIAHAFDTALKRQAKVKRSLAGEPVRPVDRGSMQVCQGGEAMPAHEGYKAAACEIMLARQPSRTVSAAKDGPAAQWPTNWL